RELSRGGSRTISPRPSGIPWVRFSEGTQAIPPAQTGTLGSFFRWQPAGVGQGDVGFVFPGATTRARSADQRPPLGSFFQRGAREPSATDRNAGFVLVLPHSR